MLLNRNLNLIKKLPKRFGKQQVRYKHPEAPKRTAEAELSGRVWQENENLANAPSKVLQPKGILPLADKVEVRKLSSGLTLAVLDDPIPVSTVSLFVKAGSRYEDSSSLGSSHFLKRLAYQSTEKKYFLPLIRDVDVRGSELGSSNSKEYVGYYVSGLRSEQNNMVETLGAIYEPRLEEWEVNIARKQVAQETSLASQDGYNVLLESIHFNAFRDSGLANSVIAPPHQLGVINPLGLRKYVNTHYQQNRMFLVGSGISMNELNDLATKYMTPTDYLGNIVSAVGPGYEDYFHVLTKPSPINDAKATYVGGGETRILGSGNTQIAIAFEGVGESNVSSSLTAQVLQKILGGGISLLKGNFPGQGRQSKLGKQVASNPWLLQANSFSISYPETGLFGVLAEAERGNVPQLVDILMTQIKSIENVTDEEVTRAKNQLKLSILDSLSADRFALTEFLVSQVDQTGSALTPSQYVSQIDSISTESVRKLAQ